MQPGDHGTAHETLNERMLHRMLFFTDAVFAIVLTLMVLDMKPPPFNNPLGSATHMQGMGSHLFALALSFAVIGVFWMAHLNTLRRLLRFDWPSAVANLAFLFPVCLIPFATGWIGRTLDEPFVWGFYCSLLMLISAANVVLVLVVYRRHGVLVGGVAERELTYRVLRAASPGIAFGLGLLTMMAGALRPAQFCWALIPLITVIVNRTLKPAAEAHA
ncbi:MAG TPA: TMEM175 family protein [Phenylobacterium sp.]|nr:TMEM175 family protein [Phenylobacterium sp.]